MNNKAVYLNDCLKNSDAYKNYISYVTKVNSNEYLIGLQNKMAILKEKICKEKSEQYLDEYNQLEKEYNSSILVKELNFHKEQLYSLLEDIGHILSLK